MDAVVINEDEVRLPPNLRRGWRGAAMTNCPARKFYFRPNKVPKNIKSAEKIGRIDFISNSHGRAPPILISWLMETGRSCLLHALWTLRVCSSFFFFYSARVRKFVRVHCSRRSLFFVIDRSSFIVAPMGFCSENVDLFCFRCNALHHVIVFDYTCV